MALKSMTGFARTEGGHGAYRWHWEIRSVNGKGLDCRFRLPAGFEDIEAALRETLGKAIKRGNCQASLQLDKEAGETRLRVNETVLNDVLEAAIVVRTAAAKAGLDVVRPATEGVLAIRGVLETAEVEEDEADQKALREALITSFGEASKALASARRGEGEKLDEIVKGQIDRIEALTSDAAKSPAGGIDAFKERLKAQVGELLEASPSLSEDRLAQEAALLATKADVREELDRLTAHVAQARELAASNEPVGRRLDFLTQEFNREANTLCSKAADNDLTRIGLDLKAVIDQLKEQVQNVE